MSINQIDFHVQSTPIYTQIITPVPQVQHHRFAKQLASRTTSTSTQVVALSQRLILGLALIL